MFGQMRWDRGKPSACLQREEVCTDPGPGSTEHIILKAEATTGRLWLCGDEGTEAQNILVTFQGSWVFFL